MQEVKVGQVWQDEHNYKVEVVGVGELNLAYRSVIDGRYGSRGVSNFKNTFSMIKDSDSSLSDLEIVQKALKKIGMYGGTLVLEDDGSCLIYEYPNKNNPNAMGFSGLSDLVTFAKKTIGEL